MSAEEREDDFTAPPAREMRLICYATQRPVAALFPADANDFSPPVWIFPLASDQELPRIAPGALVTVRMIGSKQPAVVDAGDTVLTTDKAIRNRDAFPLFAERENALAHPAVVGWKRSRRFARPASLDPVSTWTARARKRRIAFWTLVALYVAYAIALVVLAANGHGGGGGGGGAGAALGGTASVTVMGGGVGLSARQARRAKQALKEAVAARSIPGVPMQMTLKWVAGFGVGPMALGCLLAPSGEVSVPLANVPEGFDPRGLVSVLVHGDPHCAPVIEAPGVELWPLDLAHLVQ